MPVGDIIVETLEVGDIDLTIPEICLYGSFNIYEDLFNPYGASADILVNDYQDAIGRSGVTGNDPVKIAFSLADGSETLRFDMKCFECKDLDNDSVQGKATLSKRYTVRAMCPEYFNAQARGNVQKSYDMPISEALKDLFTKTGFQSDKSFEIREQTKGKIRHIAMGHPIKIFQELNNKAVSANHKSSAFVLFSTGDKYVYTTVEQLVEQSAKVNLKQSSVLGTGATEEEKQNSILDIVVTNAFFTPMRAKLDTRISTYDPATGKASYPTKKPSTDFKRLGKSFSKSIADSVNPFHLLSAMTQHDRINNKTPTYMAEAKQNREAFISDLTQNYAELTVPGNPKIKLGDVINIELYNKSVNEDPEEKVFNHDVLVTAIRHMILPSVQTPRYRMKLRVTKVGGTG